MKKWTSLILLLTFFSCNKIIDFFPKPDPDPKPPLPSFNRVFGGQEYDYGNAITETPDSGYLFAGSTQSNDFDASGNPNYPFPSGWIVKLNKSGAKEWHKTIAGTRSDHINAIAPSPNGGYILAGNTYNINRDAWIVKIDELGEVIWQKMLGGSAEDDASAVVATTDGGCVMAGFTRSNDGDVSGRQGQESAWVVRLDGSGNIKWQKLLDGTAAFDRDRALSITASADGDYTIAGYSYRGANSEGANGNMNALAARLDKDGNLLWRQSMGGAGFEQAHAITKSTGGGFVLTGISSNPDTGPDVLVIKLNSDGTPAWQKTYGGPWEEKGYAVTRGAAGGYLIAASTNGDGGDVSGWIGDEDVWLLKIDEAGNKKWQKVLGGTRSEGPHIGLLSRSDGSYVLAATTESNDVDVPGTNGESDAWVRTVNEP
jgi:hypothetical protein